MHEQTQSTQNKPFIIEHPETGQNINIRSFLNLLEYHETDAPLTPNIRSLNEKARDANKYIALTVSAEHEDDKVDKASVHYFLYSIEDMLRGIQIITDNHQYLD